MDILSIINNLFYKNSYKCISCGKSIERDDTYDEIIDGNIGICLECIGNLSWTSTALKFYSKFDNETEIFSPFYYEGLVRKIITDYKFNGMYAYSSVLAQIIHYRLDEPHIDIPSKFDMIVPVPLSKQRMIERGYNQSALIAEKLAKLWNLEYCDDALIRTRNTSRQSAEKNPEGRSANVRNAFAAVPEKVIGKRIIIFDDIYTYGYTVNECAFELKKSGAKSVSAVTAALAVNAKYMLI